MVTWYFFALLSGFLVALADIVRKHVLNHEHALEQLVAQAPFNILVIMLVIPFVHFPRWEILLLLYASSLVLTSALLYRNKAYRHLPISTVAPMMNMSPVILLVLASLLLSESPTVFQVGGIVLIAIGGYALELKSRDPLEPFRAILKNKYYGVLFFSLTLLSFMAVIDKYFLQVVSVDIWTYLFWIWLFTTINHVLGHYFLFRWEGVKQDLRKGWLWLFLVALLSIGSITSMYNALIIPGVLVSLAVPLRRINTLIETLFGGRLFHEEHVWRKAGACLVMILGVLFVV